MKKMNLALAAAVMAISLSAFTTNGKTAVAPPYKYFNGPNLVNVPSGINVPSLCPAGLAQQCVIEINGVDEEIYHSDGSDYIRN